MRIHIKVNSQDTMANSGRILEVQDGEDVSECFICDQPAQLHCSEYPDVHYCSEEHKGMHEHVLGDEDEVRAFPFTIKYRSGVGRYMVAARDIQPGELIFSEEPLATGPNHNTKPCCLECMRKVDGSYLCSKCQLPMCEEMCSFAEDHSSNECEIFSLLDPKVSSIINFEEPSTIYWTITVLRLLLKKLKDPPKYAIVQRMEDHLSEHAAEQESWALYKEHVVDFLRQHCHLASKFSEDEIFHVLGVIDVNSVKIHSSSADRSDGNQYPGHALYPITALISHGCLSNSKTILLADYTNECRATILIPRGEEITKQYVSPIEPTNMRRAKLMSGWYFECQCSRCCDPTENESFVSATSCLRCKNGIILPENPLDLNSSWSCDLCDFQTNGEAVDKLVNYFLDKIRTTRIEAVDALEALLDKAAKMFHPNHYVMTLIRITMNTAYMELTSRMEMEPDKIPPEVFMRRKDLLDQVQKVIDIVEPGLTRRRGISLFESSICHLQLGRLLHKADRFSAEDFEELLETEIASLQEALKCLEHHPEGTLEAATRYKCEAALYEAEYTKKSLTSKVKEIEKEAQTRKEQRDAKEKAAADLNQRSQDTQAHIDDFDYLDGLLEKDDASPPQVSKAPTASGHVGKSGKQKKNK